jgi:hypothetical protein
VVRTYGNIAKELLCRRSTPLGIPTRSYSVQWDHLLEPDGS